MMRNKAFNLNHQDPQAYLVLYIQVRINFSAALPKLLVYTGLEKLSPELT